MNILHVTKDNFEAMVLKSEKPVLVDFFTEWCGDCKRIAPLLEVIAEKRADNLVVVKVDCEAEPELKQAYNVMAYPTLYVFKNGQHGQSLVEPSSKTQIDAFIDA